MEADVGNLTTCSKKSKNYYTTEKKLPKNYRIKIG